MIAAFNFFTVNDRERTAGRDLKPCSTVEATNCENFYNIINADAVKAPEVLTLELRARFWLARNVDP
jgi:hypothetical protein